MKKLFTILGIVTLSIRVFGQADTDNVNIPDTNFKKKLVENTVINTNGDAEISYGEAKEYKEALDVSFSNISDITGIEAFINITSLNLNNNQLKSLDLSKNIELVDLWCSNNQLTSLNLGGNFVLSRVYCSNNQLTSLDLSENKVLTRLSCAYNKLKSLDLSKNTALISLFSSNNSLVQLNLANGNNKNMSVDATKNPSLTCIQTDSDFRASRAWRKDSTASYNENCNYPKLSIQDTKNIEFLEILNPVRNTLIINTTAKIEKIEIYNAMGQLVKVVQKDNLQVSDLAKGIYITKIITNNNIITKKIVKE